MQKHKLTGFFIFPIPQYSYIVHAQAGLSLSYEHRLKCTYSRNINHLLLPDPFSESFMASNKNSWHPSSTNNSLIYVPASAKSCIETHACKYKAINYIFLIYRNCSNKYSLKYTPWVNFSIHRPNFDLRMSFTEHVLQRPGALVNASGSVAVHVP